MSRYAKDRSGDHPKPVKRIEVSDDHLVLRIVLFVLAVAIAAASITLLIRSLSESAQGWVSLEVTGKEDTAHCGDEFICSYYVPTGTLTAELNKIKDVYSDACVAGYRIFDTYEDHGFHNLCYINAHPGEEIEINPILYQAFEKMEKSGTRALYLGLVYDMYKCLFYEPYEKDTAVFDPVASSETAALVQRMAEFAQNPEAVSLTLLGDSKVCLRVSDAYKAFAKENECEVYLDFFWMKNAFLADYIADCFIEAGYTNMVLSSYDGFIRNLTNVEPYGLNIYHRIEGTVYSAATVTYTGPLAIVQMRDYPFNAKDTVHYREMKDRSIRSCYIDEKDGICKTSLPELYMLSKTQSCADILLQAMPVYVAGSFNENKVEALDSQGIYSVWFSGTDLLTNSDILSVSGLYTDDNLTFRAVKLEK